MVADGKGRRSRNDKGRGKGKGRTLPAEERPWHKAFSGPGPVPKRTAWKQEKERKKGEGRGTDPAPKRQPARGRNDSRPTRARVAPGRRSTPSRDAPELLVGRNPVVEALRFHVPATTLYVALGIDIDDRVNEIVRTAADRGLPIMEVSRAELDRMTGGVLHQGVGLQVPPFAYELFEDLLAAAAEHPQPSLLIGLDGVTDPRNLGAVVRSAAAFGAQGVFLPARRSAGITATAWRTSAGAAARLPVSRVTNLTRAIKTCQDAGYVVVGLDADAELSLFELEVAVGPLALIVGSEGRGLSRLVRETCDLRVAIPMASGAESLNASVAAAVALAEVYRKRAGAPVASPS